MPKEFWVEAIATAVYILNRSPTRSVYDKTSEEAWSGRRPSTRVKPRLLCKQSIGQNTPNKIDDDGSNSHQG